MTSLTAPPSASARPLRRNRNFGLLVAGHGTSLIGNAAVPLGVSFAALHLSGGSARAVAWVLAAETVPTLVLVLFGGIWADRLNRRNVMVAADLLRLAAAAAAGTALLCGVGGIGLLAALMAVYGVGVAFFQPALAGLIPHAVSAEPSEQGRTQLQRADGILMAVSGGSWVLGPAAAGLLVAAAGPGAVFVFDAATFAVSATCVGLIRLPATPPPPAGRGLWGDLADGWQEFTARRWVWLTIASVGAMFAFVVAPLNAVGPAVADARLGGATGWAAVVAALSLGRVGGGVLAAFWMPRRPLLVGSALVLLEAPAMLALALDTPLGLVALAQGVGGIGVGFFLSVWGFTLQSWIPPGRLSRVNSYDWFGTLLAMPLGYGLVAVAVDRLGSRPVLLASSALVLVAVGPLLLSRSVITLRRGPDITEATR